MWFYFWMIPFFLSNLDTEAGLINWRNGEPCQLKTGGTGLCKNLTDCSPALSEIKLHGNWPSICPSAGQELIVCCDCSTMENATTLSPSSSTDLPTKSITDLPITTTTIASTSSTTNIPITTAADTRKMVELSTAEAMKIAKKKCSEYSKIKEDEEKGGKSAIFVVGGEPAGEFEFPHMAHLGYDTGNITYKCGASLISEEFLLTAAHCLYPSDEYYVTLAKLGRGNKKSEITVAIEERIPHPQWNPLKHYHDIALLRLAEPIFKTKFNNHTRPACIKTEKKIEEIQGEATGWGRTSLYGKEGSDVLLKVKLPFQEHSECSKTYRKNRFLNVGIDDDSMFCAGRTNSGMDTCPGDSGGPIQVYKSEKSDNKLEKEYYSIVGITSFGSNCGQAPGVYTRVSNYVPWIVSNVWPNEIRSNNNSTMETTTSHLSSTAIQSTESTTYNLSVTSTGITPLALTVNISSETTASKRNSTEITDAEIIKIAKDKCYEYTEPDLSCFAKIYCVPTVSSERNFSHMAHLGYGTGNIKYECVASLISEEFLLTAAHCLQASEGSQVTVAKLRTGDNQSEIISIKEKIPHPKWNPSSRYNDIALLRLENPIQKTEFNIYTRPACIQTEKKLEEKSRISENDVYFDLGTCWGSAEEYGENNDILLKAELPIKESSACIEPFIKNKFLDHGFDDESMICAGGIGLGEDTCPGDSGGPLQVLKQDLPPKNGYAITYYGIVGITSMGSDNGRGPGVYTRISNYAPWIVSNVWADEVGFLKAEKNATVVDYRLGFFNSSNKEAT